MFVTRQLKRLTARQVSVLTHRPYRANLEVTYRCNLRCKMCRLWEAGRDTREQELTTAEWQRVIDELTTLGVHQFSLIGAEPLIRHDIATIVRHISDHGAECSMTSNGLLLTEERIGQLLDAGLSSLTISIDGPPEVHDAIRNHPQLTKKLQRNIEALHRARKQCGGRRPEIRLHSTVCRENVANLEAIAQLAMEFRADALSMQYISETPSSAVNGTCLNGICIADDRFTPTTGSLLLQSEDIPMLRAQMRHLQTGNYHPRPSVAVVQGLNDSQLTSGRFPLKRCYIPFVSVIVTPTGDLTPCAHLTYTYGNIRQTTISDARKGHRFKELTSHVHRHLFPVCFHCCNYMNNLTSAQLLRLYAGVKL